jgi:hypothetical protein
LFEKMLGGRGDRALNSFSDIALKMHLTFD